MDAAAQRDRNVDHVRDEGGPDRQVGETAASASTVDPAPGKVWLPAVTSGNAASTMCAFVSEAWSIRNRTGGRSRFAP